jgi:epoxide hydrolase-like predicted phosphatase
MSMAIKAVVFDIGGVLEVNPRTGWDERWARRLGLTPAEFEQRLDVLWRGGDIGTVTLEQIERQTAEALGLDDGALSELMGAVWAEYVGTLNRPMAEYFTRLRPRFRTGIVSNSFVGAREREQTAYDFEGLCDTIVYSHEVGCRKPDPTIYHIVCERLSVTAAEVLFLDDVQANVDAARDLGMHAVTFTRTEQAIAELENFLSRPTTN